MQSTREPGEPAVIEIIERVEAPDPSREESPVMRVVVPGDILINGERMLVSSVHPVKIDDIGLGNNRGLVYVTVTLIASKVSIGQRTEAAA